VLKALLRHDVRNLYIFCDGPKNQQDCQAIATIRKLVGTIRWTAPKLFFRDTNQGLARSVVGAVDRVLAENDRIILLEDDCVPSEYFFEFMDNCLTKYADNDKIFGINGYTVPIPDKLLADYPYDAYFYPRIGSWGWATWKRAWKHYHRDLGALYNRCIAGKIDLTQGGEDIPSQVRRVLAGHDAWTLNWVLSVYLNDGYYVYPTVSHIRNIGFDGSGTNFGTSRSRFENPTPPTRPVCYPPDIVLHKPLIDHYNSFFKVAPKTTSPSVLINHSKPVVQQPILKNEASDSSRKLSIVHINTHDVAGGASKVAWRLAEAQRAAGHRSVMLTGVKNCDSPHTFAFDTGHNPDILMQCRRTGQLYYEFQGSHKLIDNPIVKSADILNLHNLHGYYFNPFSLSALSRAKPTVWTLHDMQSFTGHCAHSFDCTGWRTGCAGCDHLDFAPELPVDTAAQLLADKKLIYDHSRLQIVTPSRWLRDMVGQSILKDHPVELICNGIDTEIFRPSDKQQARSEFAIPHDATVIGAVAIGSTLHNVFKGGAYTEAVLKALSGGLSKYVFVNIGGSEASRRGSIINIPRIDDEATLARAYSAMDIFLYTPLADNCPLVVLEALACGLPIVTFDTGGVGELVRNGVDGFVVGHKDVPQTVRAVANLADNRALRTQFAQNARQSATKTFDHRITAQKYENLYHRLLADRVRNPRLPEHIPAAKVPQIVKTPEFIAAEYRADQPPVQKAPLETVRISTAPKQYDVTVVLGTKDRAQLLDQMLHSLKSAATGINCEVIAIEGGSGDETIDVLHRHGIERIYSEKQVLGPGRHSWSQIFNFGFSRARGKWAMYGSDDIIYGKDCLKNAVDTLRTQDDTVAGGLFFYKNKYTRPDWDIFGIDFTYGPKLLMNYGIFRMDLFRQVGGLNEQYRFYCGDGDMCYKYYSTGRQFVVVPDCFIVHDNMLDKHKQEHADISRNDIALYKENWKHYVSLDLPDPRRLLWHEDYIEACRMPSTLPRKTPALDLYWHGLSYFQYGMFEKASDKFARAIEQGLDHDLVRWFLDKARQKVSPSVSPAAKQILANQFIQQNKSSTLPQPAPTNQTETKILQDTTTPHNDGGTLNTLAQRGLFHPSEPLRLHLGCGKWRFDGYVNIDYPPAEHTTVGELGADFHADITQLSFPDATVDEIRLHHVFEHFNRVTALALLIKWHRWLKDGGILRIETPDLAGSAKTILSDASWKTKMAAVRHLAGDQAARWAYHVDHWFAERFDHTLRHLGYDSIRTQNTTWNQPPYLCNIEVSAVKLQDRSIRQQITSADELLWESTVADKERDMWEIWRNQLRAALAINFSSEPRNASELSPAGNLVNG
jgi:glycosyltransferase involved in cell wall biosynthesis/predicted SAM-dependent methyltransferase